MLSISRTLPPSLKKRQIDKNKFEDFSKQYLAFFDSLTSIPGTEEQQKTKLGDFLKKLFPQEQIGPYEGRQYQGFFSRVDLAIGKNAAEPKVIIETKMIDAPDMMGWPIDQFNKKALAEIILYYFDIKINENKNCVKRLIVTDFLHWFVFESSSIDNILGRDADRLFGEYKRGRQFTFSKFDIKTTNFYKEFQQFLKDNQHKLGMLYDQCLYFELDKKESTIKNLYKVFSLDFLYREIQETEHKALDEHFYKEILHIMGLCEIKVNGKNTISELPAKEREAGSFLEQVKRLLKRRDHEPSFEIALELVITWFNRILFFKLLETRLQNWHPDKAKDYHFLTNDKIKSFSELDGIFLEVLSHPLETRDSFWDRFSLVPFMNSSLFVVSDVEKKHDVFLSAIISAPVTICPDSVIDDPRYGKKYPPGTQKPLLEYLFDFLEGYDFGKQDIGGFTLKTQTVIDPTVLGLLFEKINGYKDGSYYTPSFITEFMANYSIELGVVRKANELFGMKPDEQFDSVTDVVNYVGRDKEKRNILQTILETFTICDPAVGSGHFLVSCLNKLLQLKYFCSLIKLENGTYLNNEVDLKIENDSLKIIDNNTQKEYIYAPNNERSGQIQKALFNEKRRIIENCLFGVDINPKAVIICRLRLWIELLKNAYYNIDPDSGKMVLQVMPNLDYNIREGNSLLSMFDIKVGQAPAYISGNLLTGNMDSTGNMDWLVDYRVKVAEYKNIFDHTKKKELEKSIKSIKDNIQIVQPQGKEKVLKFFEWVFEFPELINNDGSFKGFDLVIANPPYISAPGQELDGFLRLQKNFIVNNNQYSLIHQKWDLYVAFLERAGQLISDDGLSTQIVPELVASQLYGLRFREKIVNEYRLIAYTDLTKVNVFEEATVRNCILSFDKKHSESFQTQFTTLSEDKRFNSLGKEEIKNIVTGKNKTWDISRIGNKVENIISSYRLGDFCYLSVGMVLNADEKKHKGEFTKDDLLSDSLDAIHSKPYVEAKFISPYKVNSFKWLEWNTERCPGYIRRKTFPELYTKPKLLSNRLGKPQSFFDQEGTYYHSDSMYSIVLWKDLAGINNKSITNSIRNFCIGKTRQELESLSEKVSLKFLLGLLNSKLGEKLISQERGSDYHIYPEHLRNIPIIIPEKEQNDRIEELVDLIIEKKSKNEDTSSSEEELNKEFERLYERASLDETA